MSLKIEILLSDEPGVSRQSLEAHMAALGFTCKPFVARNAEDFVASLPKDALLSSPVADAAPTETKVEPARRTRKSKDDKPAQAISTGGERIDPDEPEVEAQDAADEAAEANATAAETAPAAETLTLDSLRKEMGAYQQKFGMSEIMEDGPVIFNKTLGEPPVGEAVWRVSIIPQDQPTLAKIVGAWRAAAASAERYGK